MIIEKLFDLTDEEILLSKKIYNNKIIKCLIAPFHTYKQLENLNNLYLFPERDLTYNQTKQFVSSLIEKPNSEEIKIITNNQNIILDIIDPCIRILTIENNIVNSPCKTFAANLYELQQEIYENPLFNSEKINKHSYNVIIDLINKIKTGANKNDISSFKEKINLIADKIISYKLNEMVEDIKLKDNGKN